MAGWRCIFQMENRNPPLLPPKRLGFVSAALGAKFCLLEKSCLGSGLDTLLRFQDL